MSLLLVFTSGGAPAEIQGALNATLDAVTLAATGTVDIAGTASLTLEAVTLASSATVEVRGALTATLADVTALGTGTVDVSASATATLGDATLVAIGAVDIAATASITLADVTLAATGTVSSDITASASILLGDVTLAATGTVDVSASATATLDAVTLASTAIVDIAATATATLADVTLAATATVEGTIALLYLQGIIMPTTEADIVDHIVKLIRELVPAMHVGDRFEHYNEEGDGDFGAWAEAAGVGSHRKFQVRDTGAGRSPDVTNTDVTALLMTVEIMVAYPQTHRAGPQNALDRDQMMRSDQKQIEGAVGLYGYANFTGVGGPQAAWVEGTSARAEGNGVDFLIIRQTMRFHRTTA